MKPSPLEVGLVAMVCAGVSVMLAIFGIALVAL